MRLIIVLIVSTSLLSCSYHSKKLKTLKLIKAYEVETQGYLEPSGLTQWDGEFYTVSDKQDKIFRLKFNKNTIDLVPFITITNTRNTKLDFEGITHDDNYFYLISEMYFQILRVSKDGMTQQWMNQDESLKKAGKSVGLFQRNNAYFESICYLGDGNFLLGAERDPRGFVEYNANNNLIKAYVHNESIFTIEENRSTDFTGLSCDKNHYVLERNAYVVSQLKVRDAGFRESRGWSYQHIIEMPEFRYIDMKYGQAEGLVVKGNKIHLILDNNRSSYKNNPKNNNSLFLIMQK